MIGTIDLYKLALTPNDTMYFDSVNAQTEWFNNQEHLSIDNITFNGDRAFRLGQNYLDVVFNYNYVRYKLNDRYIYAFIENVIYNNDNTSSLNISIDLNQTFLQELQTAISTSNVGNRTLKNDTFKNTYLPYDNTLTVAKYITKNRIGALNPIINVYGVGYIMVNIDPQAFGNTIPTLEDNYIQTNCCCICFPIFYNYDTKHLETKDDELYFSNAETGDTRFTGAGVLTKFLTKYSSYIVNSSIALTFNQLANIANVTYDINRGFIFSLLYDASQGGETRIINLELESGLEYPLLCVVKNNRLHYNSFDLSSYLSNIPYPIQRQPYMYLRLGNDKEYITLNLAEYLSQTYLLEIKSFNSCMFPFTSTLNIKYGNAENLDKNILFNLTTSIPIPFVQSAWNDYYSTHSASINDGLATQQKFERQISQNNRNLAYAEAGVRSAMGFMGGATDATMGLMTLNFAKLGKGLSKMVNTGVDLGFDIAGATVNYNNSELQREKERALLEISWNDIKSSPSEYSNVLSSISSYYASGIQNIEIDLYMATNIEDIIKYHKYYGYKVNRMEKLTWQDIKQHTVFDYISFNTITLKSTLPQFYTAMIEQQYEQGVRFWYDYDNFMNYEIENEEVQ